MQFSQRAVHSIMSLGNHVRSKSRGRKDDEGGRLRRAPHAIPKGSEGLACPITGLFADESALEQKALGVAALAEMQADPDIQEELATLAGSNFDVVRVRSNKPQKFVPFNVVNRAHKANSETRRLVRMVGFEKLHSFTAAFYEKCFADPHVDKFIRKHSDPHSERFALWIVEKFGDGTPWTESRKSRPRDLMQIGGQVAEVAYDRSSAHFAAWHSPKREAHKIGQHFKLDDARVWMRLHFWAAREVGLFEPQYAAFMDYYVRFIGHFVSVYSRHSPPFTRESARWSANPQNIEKYLAAGNFMFDVIDKSVEDALRELPEVERTYTGSSHPHPAWPYDTVL
jgi:truncated hemoglobin YjbI